MEAFKYTWTWGTRYSQKETLSFSACSVVFGSVLNSKSVKTKAETLREPQKVTAKKHCQVIKTSFCPWNLQQFSSRFAGTKTSLTLENPGKFSARFARKMLHVSPLEIHKTSTFCVILLVDFGRKQSNVSFYRFNFEKFCVSFFNVSFYWVVILLVHFWKKFRLRRVSFYWVIILLGQLLEIFATQM